jgi:sugar-specific transcriptional regulator TrmB
MAALYPLLASGRTSAAEAGLALGVSKTVAYEYLAAMRTYGYAEVTGGGRSSGWQLPERPEVPEEKRAEVDRHIAARETIGRYETLEDLAQAAHDGLVDVDEDLAQVLEEVRRIADRKRLSVVRSALDGDGE